MPELPEVEMARRHLVRWFSERRVVRAEADKTRVFRGANRSSFEQLRGRLETLSRTGKYLLFRFERGHGLVSHLGMTGKWVKREAGVTEPYSRARFHLDSGDVIHYRDPRMFGRLEPARADALETLPSVRLLGPDPLNDGLSAMQLSGALAGTRRPLKVALMDQSRLAGLGNLHVAEALFRAGLHPARRADSLSHVELGRLVRGIRAALDFGLRTQEEDEVSYLAEEGGGEANPFFVYGRLGEGCRRCRSPIARFVQGGRSTYFCAVCQPRRSGARRAVPGARSLGRSHAAGR